MVNSSQQVLQNLSIENKREFETQLCQVKVVKNNKKREMIGFTDFLTFSSQNWPDQFSKQNTILLDC